MQPGSPASAVRGEDRLVRMIQDMGRDLKEVKAALPHDHTGDQVTSPVAEANGSSYAFNNVVGGTTTYAVYVGNDGGFHFGRPTSSIRYKTNVRAHLTDPANILALTPVLYDRPPREVVQPDGTVVETPGTVDEFGLIAEQVYDLFPELVTWYEGKIDGVRYDLLSVALLNVIKVQDVRITALENMARTAGAEKAQTGGKYTPPVQPEVVANRGKPTEEIQEDPLPYTIQDPVVEPAPEPDPVATDPAPTTETTQPVV